ncbi:MAG: polysaccharide biosynthesis/export family protein [Myxococcales bacterium]|nr:polysaccharide biosynthesis/export family protein [Myxococcales bacterium]
MQRNPRVSRSTWMSLFVAMVVLASCGKPRAPDYPYDKEPDPRRAEYVLGVGDQVYINVWENSALTTDATVRPDGTITMPLIGDLVASGETPSSLKTTIQKRLVDYVKLEGTEITVSVREVNSYRFTISGEVVRPGIFTSAQYVTVAEAVALAGGFTRFADRNKMTLMRRDAKSGKVRNIPLVYDLLATGDRPDMNLFLLAGDSLFVP